MSLCPSAVNGYDSSQDISQPGFSHQVTTLSHNWDNEIMMLKKKVLLNVESVKCGVCLELPPVLC